MNTERTKRDTQAAQAAPTAIAYVCGRTGMLVCIETDADGAEYVTLTSALVAPFTQELLA